MLLSQTVLDYRHTSMMKDKHITRYENTKGASYTFRGWRLCITRSKARFVRYFSDREYGSPEAGREAALRMRDEMLAQLDEQGLTVREVFFSHSKEIW